jgi:hypothetical protein
VAQETEVREAAVRWDRATPSTHRDLVAARLAAQARLGIPAAERAPLYSGEVEDFLVPVTVRMGRGEEGAVLVELRKELTRLYGEFSESFVNWNWDDALCFQSTGRTRAAGHQSSARTLYKLDEVFSANGLEWIKILCVGHHARPWFVRTPTSAFLKW